MGKKSSWQESRLSVRLRLDIAESLVIWATLQLFSSCFRFARTPYHACMQGEGVQSFVLPSLVSPVCGGCRAFRSRVVCDPSGTFLNFMFLDCVQYLPYLCRHAARPLTLANACCPAGSDLFSAMNVEARAMMQAHGGHSCCFAVLMLPPIPRNSSHPRT